MNTDLHYKNQVKYRYLCHLDWKNERKCVICYKLDYEGFVYV